MKISDLKQIPIGLSAVLLCLSAHSQTFQVTTTADSGPGSLRDAMTNAIATGGGTIIFPNVSGTISLQSALPDISVPLTIIGNGPGNVTIDGNQLYRIFHIAPGIVCEISGLNMQGGFASTDRSPLYSRTAINNEGTLSLSNCFLHNSGPPPTYPPGIIGAGALASSGQSLVLNDITISDNYSRASAGLSARNVSATNCLFMNNRTDDGAPIGAGGDSIFNNCTFTQNKAWLTGEGGGISAGGNLTLLNCSITNNYGDYAVNGILFSGNNLVISNSVINNNAGSSHISAIKASGSNIVVLNSSICGNFSYGDYGIVLNGNAYLSGCAICSNSNGEGFNSGISISGTLNLTNCTISGNSSTYQSSSAIEVGDNSTVQAVNCTIAFNGYGVQTFGNGTFYALNTIIADNGTGPTNGDFSGTLTSQGNNLIGNLNTNTIIIGSTNGNIYGADPLLGPLQNSGGPTPTHALLRGSPAINAGTSIGAPLTDQRGVARPCGKEVDIGAFEYDALLFTGISCVNSTNIHLQVEGPPGSVCTIQASSNFLDWESVFASGNGTMGVWEFVDQDAGNHPNRFYRARLDD
jgi:hypothetical protein